jgi:AraC-like DNA-binding protein
MVDIDDQPGLFRLPPQQFLRAVTDAGETAEGSAFKVGYKSASQFSQEYSRMFGNSPLRDAMKMKTNGNSEF